MKLVNVLLAIAVSLAVALGVLEGGLRMLGLGPQPTINRFDADLGWVKTPGAVAHRKTGEFDITFHVNALGLRDDEMASAAKPPGTYRVLALGDSFVLGYTVDRKDLFVDILEQWWKAEGRPVDVINAGTEGWSTDQEVLWLEKHGRELQPDLVLLFPYENDLYWNAKTHYDRYPKPRFNPKGESERIVLQDPGPPTVAEGWAAGRFLKAFTARRDMWSPAAGSRLPMEWVAYFRDEPEPMKEVRLRTRGALSYLKRRCDEMGAALLVVPIPNKACAEGAARETLVDAVQGNGWLSSLRRWIKGQAIDPRLGLDRWTPDLPVDTFLSLCAELQIPALDPRDALREGVKSASSGHVYYQRDWHLNPDGNRALARFVHDEIGKVALLPPPARSAEMPVRAEEPPSLGWLKVFAGLWAALSLTWIFTYRKDPAWQAPLKVGTMLALVFSIVLGGRWILDQIPPAAGQALAVLFVLGLFGFILWKLGRRIGTIVELFVCFVARGHWYLIPLVVVLLTVGSLLVVAASSPLVAPFIYTLF